MYADSAVQFPDHALVDAHRLKSAKLRSTALMVFDRKRPALGALVVLV
jgi:hypothetical protein